MLKERRHQAAARGHLRALLGRAALRQRPPQEHPELHVLLGVSEHHEGALAVAVRGLGRAWWPGAELGPRGRQQLVEGAPVDQLLAPAVRDRLTQQQGHEPGAREEGAVLHALGGVHQQHHHVVPENLVLEPISPGQRRVHEVPEGLDDVCLAESLGCPVEVQLEYVPEDLGRHQQHVRAQQVHAHDVHEVGYEAAVGDLLRQGPVQRHVPNGAERDHDRLGAVLVSEGSGERVDHLRVPEDPQVGGAGVCHGLDKRLVGLRLHAVLVKPEARPARERVRNLDADALEEGAALLEDAECLSLVAARGRLLLRRQGVLQHAHQDLDEGRQVVAVGDHVRGPAAHQRLRGHAREVADGRGELDQALRKPLDRELQKLHQVLQVLQQEAIAAGLADLADRRDVTVHQRDRVPGGHQLLDGHEVDLLWGRRVAARRRQQSFHGGGGV
mmetsp:Transcript_63911/g.172511  ORF Transcript_63911/g.172511 Transcript_63911/m.172511 type:complete len:443 (+) Transcript_63911:1610-2938(+)